MCDVQILDDPRPSVHVVVPKTDSEVRTPIRSRCVHLIGDGGAIEDVATDPSDRKLCYFSILHRRPALARPRPDEKGKHIELMRRMWALFSVGRLRRIARAHPRRPCDAAPSVEPAIRSPLA